MTEQELRQLVRETIARHLAAPQVQPASPVHPHPHAPGTPVLFHRDDPAHARFNLGPGADGSCYIEPNVTCNQCGFCKSYGH